MASDTRKTHHCCVYTGTPIPSESSVDIFPSLAELAGAWTGADGASDTELVITFADSPAGVDGGKSGGKSGGNSGRKSGHSYFYDTHLMVDGGTARM